MQYNKHNSWGTMVNLRQKQTSFIFLFAISTGSEQIG